LGLFFVCGDTVQTSQARFHGAELSIHPGVISDAVAVLISRDIIGLADKNAVSGIFT
jgi:hypothetical protein